MLQLQQYERSTFYTLLLFGGRVCLRICISKFCLNLKLCLQDAKIDIAYYTVPLTNYLRKINIKRFNHAGLGPAFLIHY